MVFGTLRDANGEKPPPSTLGQANYELDEPYFWWYQALLNLATGDKEEYRRICAAMLERFRTTEDPRTAHSVVSACTLLPDALPEMRN